MPETLLGTYLVKNPNHQWTIDQEWAAVVSPEDANIYWLNEVGTFIWQRADGTRTLGKIVEEMCQAFAVELDRAAQEAQVFVEECLEKRVLLEGEPPLNGAGA